MSSDQEQPPRPLDAAESAHVKSWQRLMYAYFFLAMLMIAGLYWVAGTYGDSPTARYLVLGGVAVLIIVASIVQFSGKCPRCETRLGRQCRLVLPAKCKICGVEFPRP